MTVQFLWVEGLDFFKKVITRTLPQNEVETNEPDHGGPGEAGVVEGIEGTLPGEGGDPTIGEEVVTGVPTIKCKLCVTKVENEGDLYLHWASFHNMELNHLEKWLREVDRKKAICEAVVDESTGKYLERLWKQLGMSPSL